MNDVKIMCVGYEIPAAEIPIRTAPPGLLREPGSTAISKRCSARAPTGAGLHRHQQALLRPDSYGSRAPPTASAQLRPDSYGSRAPPPSASAAPPGLLREPGSTAISKCSSARTPTGAGLHRRHQRSSLRTPTGAGLRRQHQNSSARTPTGAGLRSQYQLLVSSIRTPTRAGLHP